MYTTFYETPYFFYWVNNFVNNFNNIERISLDKEVKKRMVGIQQFIAKWIHRMIPRDELCRCVILTVGRSWGFFEFTPCHHQLSSPSFKKCSMTAVSQHSLNKFREVLVCAAVSVPLYFQIKYNWIEVKLSWHNRMNCLMPFLHQPSIKWLT